MFLQKRNQDRKNNGEKVESIFAHVNKLAPSLSKYTYSSYHVILFRNTICDEI